MSDWGQGVINNTIEWGRGADNNDIGWGSIYGSSSSGDTALEVGASFLLDTYTGASAAYSVRKLSSTATNSLRVRRSSDNAEQDIGFVGNDLDTASLISFVGVGNNGFVVTWYDQSGNGNNATTSTAANQPQIVSSGSLISENGIASIQNVSTDELPLGSNIRAYTSFFVHKQNAGSLISYVAGSVTPVLQGMFVGGSSATGVGGFYSPTTAQNAAGSDLTQALYTFQSDGSTLQLAKDGSSLSSAGSLSGLHVDRIMGRNGVGAVTGLGEYQEIIIYPTDQSANKSAIESNINAYYSIY